MNRDKILTASTGERDTFSSEVTCEPQKLGRGSAIKVAIAAGDSQSGMVSVAWDQRHNHVPP